MVPVEVVWVQVEMSVDEPVLKLGVLGCRPVGMDTLS